MTSRQFDCTILIIGTDPRFYHLCFFIVIYEKNCYRSIKCGIKNVDAWMKSEKPSSHRANMAEIWMVKVLGFVVNSC